LLSDSKFRGLIPVEIPVCSSAGAAQDMRTISLYFIVRAFKSKTGGSMADSLAQSTSACGDKTKVTRTVKQGMFFLGSVICVDFVIAQIIHLLFISVTEL